MGIVAAKMIVYSGEDEEHYTFISREAFFHQNDGWTIDKILAR